MEVQPRALPSAAHLRSSSIIPLRVVHDNENLLVNDIPSVLSEKDVDHLYDHYQISREIFYLCFTPECSHGRLDPR